MKTLSPRQREVLDLIRKFTADHGMAPSIKELAESLGIAPATAAGHLRALQKKQMLVRSSKARSIVVAGAADANAMLKIPVFGRLSSPEPASDTAGMEGAVYMHRSTAGHIRGSGSFALRIRDEAMCGLGILRGDVAVFARPAEVPPRIGNVVAAFVNGSEVVRMYFPRAKEGIVALRAADPETPEMLIPAREFKLMGVLIYLQRNYLR